jgi:hypothetical protein
LNADEASGLEIQRDQDIAKAVQISLKSVEKIRKRFVEEELVEDNLVQLCLSVLDIFIANNLYLLCKVIECCIVPVILLMLCFMSCFMYVQLLFNTPH